MPQQVQPIPFFQLQKNPLLWSRHPMLIPGMGQAMSLPTALMEFYCQSGGSNLNSGTDQNNVAKYTSTNGNWNLTNLVFTPTDGSNPVTAGVKPGDWMSVYIDGATVGVCSMRISQVVNAVNGPISYDGVRSMGSAPTTSATTRTCKVGGAWRGPNGTTNWPLSVSFGIATDLAGNPPRVNLKNDVTYTLAFSTITWVGPVGGVLQGYKTDPGDGVYLGAASQAIINCGSANPGGGNEITNSDGCIMADIVGWNASGGDTANAMFSTSAGNVGSLFLRCTAHLVPGPGFRMGNNNGWFIECEAYNCMYAGVATNGAGFSLLNGATCINCYSHDNVANNGNFSAHGFATGNMNQVTLINCISANNRGCGFAFGFINTGFIMLHCDAYNNATVGLYFGAQSVSYGHMIYNSNFIKNGWSGIDWSIFTTVRVMGLVHNCGFGANGRGRIKFPTLGGIQLINPIDYPTNTTPWSDPDNGNFSQSSQNIGLGAARGYFTQSDGVHQGTVSYPDIGATQFGGVGSGGSSNSTSILPNGFVGLAYLAREYNVAPVTISVFSGSLPPGLSILQNTPTDWSILGVPTTVGIYNYVLKITSVTNGAVGYVTEQITILAASGGGDVGGVGGG